MKGVLESLRPGVWSLLLLRLVGKLTFVYQCSQLKEEVDNNWFGGVMHILNNIMYIKCLANAILAHSRPLQNVGIWGIIALFTRMSNVEEGAAWKGSAQGRPVLELLRTHFPAEMSWILLSSMFCFLSRSWIDCRVNMAPCIEETTLSWVALTRTRVQQGISNTHSIY